MRTSVKVLFAAFAVGILAMPAWAQDSAPTLDDAIAGYESAAHQSFRGVPTDWSTRHVVFSKPAPGSDAEDKIQQDPRYWQQQIRRSLPESDASVANDAQTDDLVSGWDNTDKKKKKKAKKVKKVPIKKDWSMNLQGTASKNLEGVFPAKFSFTTASQACSDFVAFPTGQVPSGTQPSIVGFTNLYSNNTPSCGATIPTVAWSYNTTAADTALIDTSPVLSNDGKQIAFAEGTHLVFIKLPTSVTGTLTLPNAIPLVSASAYNSCATPTTGCMTAISITNTDTNSSPFYDSQDDAIYVGDDAGVLHKFSPAFLGTPTAVGSPWPVTVNNLDNLTGPVFDIGSGNVYVGDSSGFLDQVKGTTGALVQSGRLGAGAGTAAVTADAGGGDTLTVGTVTYTFHSASTSCTAPTSTTGCIIHGCGTTTEDAENIVAAINDGGTCGCTSNGVCFEVSAANPAASATNATTTITIQNTTLANVPLSTTDGGLTLTPASGGIAVGLVDAPIVDPAAEAVYAFEGKDATTTTVAGVRQLKITGGTISGVGTLASIGTSSAANPLYSGAFNNAYFTSTGATPTGTLYVCGNAGAAPTLYGITITTGTMATGTITAGPAIGTATGTTCSPVTELCNPGTSGTCANVLTGTAVDWIFLSIEASVNTTTQPTGGCTVVAGQGCVTAFNVNTAPTSSTKASSGINETAGSSGIVIDNVVSNTSGGSQVYFTPLGNQTCAGNGSVGSGSGPCATQASQSAL